MIHARRAACRLVAAAVTTVAAFSPGALNGQQMPPTGCNACVGGGHGSSAVILFRVLRGPDPVLEPRVRISLPPPPGISDAGAVEASARIVLARNRKLRENLAVAEAATHPHRPVPSPADGEVLIRIASIHPPEPGRRDDIPKNAFEAIPLRRVPYPQWSPAPH